MKLGVREIINLSTKVLERYEGLTHKKVNDRLSFYMDLEYSKINLEELLKAESVDFLHDMYGLYSHFQRDTKTWGGCFMPRCGLYK